MTGIGPILAFAAAAGHFPALNPPPQPITATWPLLAFDRSGECELQITGNGRFLELKAGGLIPGEAFDFALDSGAMKPIRTRVYANGHGAWSKFYIPFRFGADGGIVNVRLSGSRCSVAASVPWQRGVRVIP